MINKIETLSPNSIYHVYNRANGSERLFLSDDNYNYFLKKYREYISPIADTYCYCLMPNHFHFLLLIKSEKELVGLTGLKKEEKPDANYLSKQFSNLFNGYTQALNKQTGRKGSLFMRPYKRIAVTDSKYLINLVKYIHCNPVEAGICRNLIEWKYSSYNQLLSTSETFIKREGVLDWFGDIENFKVMHLNRV